MEVVVKYFQVPCSISNFLTWQLVAVYPSYLSPLGVTHLPSELTYVFIIVSAGETSNELGNNS